MFDIRIFGVEKRIDNIRQTQKILKVPDDHIIIDQKREGCLPTARKAWLLPTDKKFVIVLQDDIELCNNFLAYCTKMCTMFPKVIVSLFPLQFIHADELRWYGIPTASPYITTNVTSGCGIIMPTEFIEPCIGSWTEADTEDDVSINRWAKENGIPVITTLPPLIQHLGDDSVVRPGNAIRRSPHFQKKPEANWDKNLLHSWTNFIGR